MLDLQPLAGLRDQVQAPPYDALADTARRRDRRATLFAAAGSAAVVVAVVVGALMVTRTDENATPPVITPSLSPTPSPSPTPPPTHASATSMTPREVVNAEDARLQWTAVSADDPDFRVSVWEAVCSWCPRSPKDSRFPHPSFLGMAITKDGFATATYRHTGPLEFEEGGLAPVNVVSPGPGLLLLVDDANGGAWLVRDDGTLTRLAESAGGTPGGDPRAWFICKTDRDQPSWENPTEPPTTWCKLDAARNTVHVMGSAWWGLDEIGSDTVSVVSPASGSVRWGLRNMSFDRLVGWWDAGGTRHSKDFGPADASGAIANAQRGEMSYWAWQKHSPTLTIYTSSDEGASWHRSTVPVPYRPISPWDLDLSWTPDGGLLGLQEDAFDTADATGVPVSGVRLWRSESPSGTAFTEVYEGVSIGVETPSVFSVLDGRIWYHNLWSDDDGQTWQAVASR